MNNIIQLSIEQWHSTPNNMNSSQTSQPMFLGHFCFGYSVNVFIEHVP